MLEKLFTGTIASVFALSLCGTAMVGCEEDTALEDAAEDVGDASEDAADDLKDGAEELGDDVEEGVDDLGE